MQTITETDLLRAAEFKAIKSVRIEQTAKGTYRVYVVTTGVKGEMPLVTLRDRENPREWADLERLAKHLKNYGVIPIMTFSLYHEPKEGNK